MIIKWNLNWCRFEGEHYLVAERHRIEANEWGYHRATATKIKQNFTVCWPRNLSGVRASTNIYILSMDRVNRRKIWFEFGHDKFFHAFATHTNQKQKESVIRMRCKLHTISFGLFNVAYNFVWRASPNAGQLDAVVSLTKSINWAPTHFHIEYAVECTHARSRTTWPAPMISHHHHPTHSHLGHPEHSGRIVVFFGLYQYYMWPKLWLFLFKCITFGTRWYVWPCQTNTSRIRRTKCERIRNTFYYLHSYIFGVVSHAN